MSQCNNPDGIALYSRNGNKGGPAIELQERHGQETVATRGERLAARSERSQSSSFCPEMLKSQDTIARSIECMHSVLPLGRDPPAPGTRNGGLAPVLTSLASCQNNQSASEISEVPKARGQVL